MLSRNEIRIRDPYIIPYEQRYYMYATSGETTLSYYVSDDLDHWETGGVAFEIPNDFWAYKDVWAAEVHAYRGQYYLLVSLLGKDGRRATQIAVAPTPAGPFMPVTDRPATPIGQSCIDGTLYVQHGVPYIVYSHDWPDCYNADEDVYVGEICAARLSDDLTAIVGEPRVLFASNQAPLSKAYPHRIVYEGQERVRYGSDAPFVQKLSNGSLLLTWSPYLSDTYVVLSVLSPSGNLFGPWIHLDEPLFQDNGGHAMFFHANDGKHYMCLHAPEQENAERAHLYEVGEKDGTLCILSERKL